MSTSQARSIAILIHLAFVGIIGAFFGDLRITLFSGLSALVVLGLWVLERIVSAPRRPARPSTRAQLARPPSGQEPPRAWPSIP